LLALTGVKIKPVGYVRCDQVNLLDLAAREARFVEKAPVEVRAQVFDILYGVIEGVGS